MVIYYWKLQNPNKLIFKMISGGNLLLETPDSRQTNFQYDQRVRKCWWHHDLIHWSEKGRLFYVLFAFHV